MEMFCASLTHYKRLDTIDVKIGKIGIGGRNPIRLQTMTTKDTMDTAGTVAETIRCIEAGAELVRITAPSKKEAENLQNIQDELIALGFQTPLVADIHFTPNAAEKAATIIDKVRINPGNYIDKKKFEQIDYTDDVYAAEIDKIKTRFTPLVRICKKHGTAMRIGTNHGSLSDRIMSRYGDTPMGMVESAMEFLRIARAEDYHQIVLSMKASNPLVMVQAYRLLVKTMQEEFGVVYPLHLGVTEAGDGEDGRIKSAIGIGTLLEDGIGDTVRVSLTEDPELEIPVCRDIVKRYDSAAIESVDFSDIFDTSLLQKHFNPFSYQRRKTNAVGNIGGGRVPVVIADFSKLNTITTQQFKSIGYTYDAPTDKWHIGDAAADYVFTNKGALSFSLPGTIKVIVPFEQWLQIEDKEKYYPILSIQEYAEVKNIDTTCCFVMVDCFSKNSKDHELLEAITDKRNVVLCLSSTNKNAVHSIRAMFVLLESKGIKRPVVLISDSNWHTADEHLVHLATETGALLLDGFGDGICLGLTNRAYHEISDINASGRNYLENSSIEQFLNNTAFSILQATRTRISKTEYISCPSCGRTLFNLQETTAKIRAVTNHLKGLKIAIMGCIVNGPGEMADADFGYVGSGPGKITLYKNKEVVKRNIDSDIAVDELINLLKENGVWVDPPATAN